MKNKIINILLVLLPIFALGQQIRLFPYYLPLTGTTKPAQILEGVASANAPTGTARYTKDGIVLTNETATMAKSGFALNDIKFGSQFGIVVEFEYAMFGGTTIPGDGMSFFLFDGDVPFKLGNAGSGLGYAYQINPQAPNYNPSKPNEPTTEGVPGGFISVGLDVWGNSKLKLNLINQIVEGIPLTRTDYSNEGKNHITVRGGVNVGNKLGYPVLFSTATSNILNGIKTFTKSYRDNYGQYSNDGINVKNVFDLRTSKAANGVIKFNKVKLEIIPNPWGGVLVTIFVVADGVQYRIIDQLTYPLSSQSPDHNGNLYMATTKYPTNFKIGFAASTGSATQSHIVKNVKVDLPYAPLTVEDNVNMSILSYGGNKGKSISLSPFDNDYFYKGTIYSGPTKGNDTTFIDSNSFRFEDSTGKQLGTAGANASYTQPNVGTWNYNASTRQVTLTLSENTYVPNNLSIYYSAKGTSNGSDGGGPFNDEYYRSIPTLLKVNLLKINNIVVRLNPNMSIEKK